MVNINLIIFFWLGDDIENVEDYVQTSNAEEHPTCHPDSLIQQQSTILEPNDGNLNAEEYSSVPFTKIQKDFQTMVP